MEKKDKVYSEFLDVSKRSGVPINKVLDAFWHLSRGKAIENDSLLRAIGVSRNALNQIKKALSFYLEPTRKDTKLKESIAEEILGLFISDHVVEEMLLKTIERGIYKDSIELLSRYRERRPAPSREYDQFTATIETTAKRMSLLDFFGDVRNKRILFLGDDDFTSVVAANLKTSKFVTVVDIDDRILDEIEGISQANTLDINLVRYDARKPIPDELKGQFDVVFTDPPYTPEGIRLFVSRAIDALDKSNQTARVYFCYGNSDRAKERFLPIQEVVTSAGLMIRWIFDKFNRYQGAESIGSASSLYVTEITPKTKSLIQGSYDRSIYTLN